MKQDPEQGWATQGHRTRATRAWAERGPPPPLCVLAVPRPGAHLAPGGCRGSRPLLPSSPPPRRSPGAARGAMLGAGRRGRCRTEKELSVALGAGRARAGAATVPPGSANRAGAPCSRAPGVAELSIRTGPHHPPYAPTPPSTPARGLGHNPASVPPPGPTSCPHSDLGQCSSHPSSPFPRPRSSLCLHFLA